MKVYLFNSSMMPVPGRYELKRLNKQEFVQLCNYYYQQNQLVSYIGYEATKEHIEKIADIPVKLTRDQLYSIQPGELILICKLKFRLPTSNLKANQKFQKTLTDEDFEYFVCSYN